MERVTRILFIEDDLPLDRYKSMIWMLLEEHNFEVVPARTGSEALSYLENESFDLVLLDIMLPPKEEGEADDHRLQNVRILDMGLVLLQKLRSRELGNDGTPNDVPVVVISAVAGLERWKRIKALVGDDAFCLEKPCSPSEQLSAICAALEGAK